MKKNSRTTAIRSALAAMSFAASSTAANAGHVPSGSTVIVKGDEHPAEAWNMSPGSYLQILDGATAFQVVARSSDLVIADSTIRSSEWTGVNVYDQSRVQIDRSKIWSGTGDALSLKRFDDDFGSPKPPQVSVYDSDLRGKRGASVYGGSVLNLYRSGVIAEAVDGVGLTVYSGTANARNSTVIQGQDAGVVMNDGWEGSRTLLLSGSAVTAVAGPAIRVHGAERPKGFSIVEILDGSTLVGKGGLAIEVAAGGNLKATVTASDIAGNILVDETSVAWVRFGNGGMLRGFVRGPANISLEKGARWLVTGMSDVRDLTLDGGELRFGEIPGGHRLTVYGNTMGSGGDIAMNAQLTPGRESIDRLFVEGDVLLTSVARLSVDITGDVLSTDRNRNGRVEANEGYSLIQVAGTSTADAFQLKGGYATVGPYQYGLYAFGPGEADARESELPSGRVGWDYRLATRSVCEVECGEPVDPTPGEGDGHGGGTGPVGPGESTGPVSRAAVASQVPSYLSASAAFLSYERSLGGGLSERLGDIRRGIASGEVSGEMFARYVGGQARYTSNLSFLRYGYAFDQRIDALQLGGSVLGLDGDNGSLRAGWAWDQGSTTVSPRAVDGDSMSRYRAFGGSAWVTWIHGDGPWIDASLGARRYRGLIDTASRGKESAKVRANARSLSLEAGWPFAAGDSWTLEPRMQVSRTWINARTNVDKDGLNGLMRPLAQSELILGARVSRDVFGVLRSFLGIELTGTRGGDTQVDVGSDAARASFSAGRLGNAYRVVSGLTGQLGDSVQVYGQAEYRHGMGGFGSRMWSWQAGVRVNF